MLGEILDQPAIEVSLEGDDQVGKLVRFDPFPLAEFRVVVSVQLHV